MKRTFLAKRNALLSRANVSWGTLAVAVAILFLLLRLLTPNFFWYLLTPVFRMSDALSARSDAFLSSFKNASTLALQNEALTNQNTTLSLQNEALQQKVESTSRLVKETEGVTAGVVAHPPESPYDTLVIAAGREEGVTSGMEAFGEGNVPIGIVSSVLPHFSRITLFSTPGVSLSGWVGSAHIPLLIQGVGGGALYASVSRSANIAVGDVVSVPGPGSIPIGAIVRVDSDPSSPSVALRISPALNLFSITWVVVRDTGTALRGTFSSTTPTLP